MNQALTDNDVVVAATLQALADGAPLDQEVAAVVDVAQSLPASQATYAARHGDLAAALDALRPAGLSGDLVKPLVLCPRAARALGEVPATSLPSLHELRATLGFTSATLLVQTLVSSVVGLFVLPVFDKMAADFGRTIPTLAVIAVDIAPVVSMIVTVGFLVTGALVVVPGLLRAMLARFAPSLSRARRLRIAATLIEHGAAAAAACEAAGVEGVASAPAMRAAALADEARADVVVKKATRIAHVVGFCFALCSVFVLAGGAYLQVFALGGDL